MGLSRKDMVVYAGELVKSCRKERGLKMRELEKLSGVTASQINNIEKGKNSPTIGTFLKLLDAMEYDIEIIDERDFCEGV